MLTSVMKRKQQIEQTRRVYSLDVVRICLMLVIFLCHSSYLLPGKLVDYVGSLTGIALEMFFLISGFLAVFSRRDEENSLLHSTKNYVWGKFKKIWPLHFVMYVACFILQYIQAGRVLDINLTIKTSITNLLFLQSWTPNETYVYSYNGVSWFLSSLFFCYLLTPVAIKVLEKFKTHLVWILVMTIVVRYIYVTGFHYFIGTGAFCYTNVFPPYRFLEFFAGMTLAMCLRYQGKRKESSTVQIISIVCFFVIFILAKWNGTLSVINPIFLSVELLLIGGLSIYRGIFDFVSSTKSIQWLSGLALNFFLIHQVLIKYMRWIGGTYGMDYQKHNWSWLIISLVLVVVICFAYNKINDVIKRIVKFKRNHL